MGWNESILNEFFERRFRRKPNPEDQYFQEWKKRFLSGEPEEFMDSKSTKVYIGVLKDFIYKFTKWDERDAYSGKQ